MHTIVLVPTSHIAGESLRAIRMGITKNTDCVAVELDPSRLLALKTGQTGKLSTGHYVLLSLMKRIQDWLGRKTGIFPGAEMLHAVDLAQDTGAAVALIDQDIRVTFQRLKTIPLREKVSLVWLLLIGAGASALPGKQIDLTKVPDDDVVQEAMGFLKRRLPSFYRVLVQERDQYMAHQLLHLSDRYTTIVAVVGAGHVQGITAWLAKYAQSVHVRVSRKHVLKTGGWVSKNTSHG